MKWLAGNVMLSIYIWISHGDIAINSANKIVKVNKNSVQIIDKREVT